MFKSEVSLEFAESLERETTVFIGWVKLWNFGFFGSLWNKFCYVGEFCRVFVSPRCREECCDQVKKLGLVNATIATLAALGTLGYIHRIHHTNRNHDLPKFRFKKDISPTLGVELRTDL